MPSMADTLVKWNMSEYIRSKFPELIADIPRGEKLIEYFVASLRYHLTAVGLNPPRNYCQPQESKLKLN